MIVTATATSSDISAEQLAILLASQATQAFTPEKFTFMACFDGTNNDKKDPSYSHDTLMTNVGALYDLLPKSQPNFVAQYYPGPGTSDSIWLSAWFPPAVTKEIDETAMRAYELYASSALDWLELYPQSPADIANSITTAVTAFSRGCATAVRFAQILNEKGLSDDQGNILIPPGSATVDAMYLLDPVTTGYPIRLISSALMPGISGV